jgi:tRNA-Thr(GGU) m(6)t(6)A37 methyltransferase TsaA
MTFGKALIPREPATYRPIGVVRNRVRQSRPTGWVDVRSDIILRDELEPALAGIEGFSHLIVVFHIDRVPESARVLRLAVGSDGLERGVLASRSQQRPNPIGVAVVPLLHRHRRVLRVQGLDALDGTPVLDVKPYLPAYDAIAGATLPAWAKEPGAE